MNSWPPLPGQSMTEGSRIPMAHRWWAWFQAIWQMQQPAAPASVTQTVGKTNPVTLDGLCGQIVLDASNVNPGASATFILNNASIASTDVVVVTKTGGTSTAYDISVITVVDGACRIRVENWSAGALAESFTVNFRVLKSSLT